MSSIFRELESGLCIGASGKKADHIALIVAEAAGELTEKCGYCCMVPACTDADGKHKRSWQVMGLPIKGSRRGAEGMPLEKRRGFKMPCRRTSGQCHERYPL